MKIKFITLEECQKIKSKEEITFYAKSPISSIFLPPKKLICSAIHQDFVYGARKTLYNIRVDFNDSFPINVDAYSFNETTNEDKFELKGPIKNPLLFEQHKALNIPSFIKEKAPNWVKQKALKMFYNDNILNI